MNETSRPLRLVVTGGSDAGISAALRARELDPTVEVSVVVADAYPNFSICGIPYYVSGEVGHWTRLAHRTRADLEAAGMRLLLDTRATAINPPEHTVSVDRADASSELLDYDALVVGTGAVPDRPPIDGLDQLGVADGVHLLHSMGDTFELERDLEQALPNSALIVGAGYVGLEMAEGLTARGISVTQVEMLPEVLPTVDPELGALVRAELVRKGGHRAHLDPGDPDRRRDRRRPAASRRAGPGGRPDRVGCRPRAGGGRGSAGHRPARFGGRRHRAAGRGGRG